MQFTCVLMRGLQLIESNSSAEILDESCWGLFSKTKSFLENNRSVVGYSRFHRTYEAPVRARTLFYFELLIVAT